MHEMWLKGECVRGHTLGPVDFQKGRCYTCKREGSREKRERQGDPQFDYHEPRVNDPYWHERAICFGVADPDMFFQNAGTQVAKEAKGICANCPISVRRDCLVDALLVSRDEDFGIRGGLGSNARRDIREGYVSFEQALGIEAEPVVSEPIHARAA